ncbi:OST-HTH/LOTUS domain-containing protein [Paucibacter sp. PLA-PC-4]|uniref:OST-HTH/LOTUS domain-containing protein n=1 Tax=Paucibacter sp. PLA-PC-4 TaxID=2993655 RepID=UPI00224B3C19|nr:OST-HTH/LOTUS domain-containing protein [Paucibacter sp. PLA-PC-4]MCX2865177.1 OST-HTH/LOTUS domain-containing protein [Paucibacter sp. PLA-PC-4]
MRRTGSWTGGAAGCVSALREAALALAVDGWASVDAAADWISAQHPDQTPEKYGCRTWRQVIHESRRFDLRYRDEDGPKKVWYQERNKAQKAGR